MGKRLSSFRGIRLNQVKNAAEMGAIVSCIGIVEASAESGVPEVGLGCRVVPSQHLLVPAALQVLLQQLLGGRGDVAHVAA